MTQKRLRKNWRIFCFISDKDVGAIPLWLPFLVTRLCGSTEFTEVLVTPSIRLFLMRYYDDSRVGEAQA